MGKFEDALKDVFKNNGAMTPTSRVCLLGADGTPSGSDTIERVSSIMFTKEDLVDMGLPSGTLWCKRNLGALKETDNGYYFSWGNLNGHSKGSGYNFSDATYSDSPAASIAASLTVSQDAARANLGKAWRMPSKEEFAELCNSEYVDFIDGSGNVISGTDKSTTYNGVVGLRIKSKANGNILFLPAAGFYSGTTLHNEGSSGYYWSSSFSTATHAYGLSFGSGGVIPQDDYSRRYGFSVRPVI